MKSKLIKKDPILCKILIDNSGPGRYHHLFKILPRELLLRELFLGFLNDYFQPPMSKRRGHKSKTVHFEIRARSVMIEPNKISNLIEEHYHRQQQCMSPRRVVDEENK